MYMNTLIIVPTIITYFALTPRTYSPEVRGKWD